MGFIIPKPYNIENHVKILLSRLFPLKYQYYTYINVQNNCPRGLGLQSQQNIINPQSGHCLAWSLLFIHVRINNLFLSTDYIMNYFNKYFTPTDLDAYMKRYIGLLETSTYNINTKTLPNFKYNLILSPQEKLLISDHITYLTKKYLQELNNNKDKTIINNIFEELISYHKFTQFNEIFFKNFNYFIQDLKSLPKRKLSNTYESIEKKLKQNIPSPLQFIFNKIDKQNPIQLDYDYASESASESESESESASKSASESESESASESESESAEEEDELKDLYKQFK